ncbi:MAG: class I SAM-dependent methyltransferase [Gaiellaceae bacterium]
MDHGPEGEDARRRRAVVASFETRFADPESVAYARMHAPRYEILLGAVETAIAGRAAAPVSLLDVGPSFQTEAIRELYPGVRVDSLGFLDARFPPPRDGERHIDFDLNDADDPSAWPASDPYDVIVCAEVVEHLHTSPAHVFRLFASLLRSRGRLVLQTPNAAALSRRFWLLAGRNPYEPIREDKRQAGHFREYTAAELHALLDASGFDVTELRLANYFLTGSRKNRFLVRHGDRLPAGLRQGITIAATKRT